MPTVALVVTDLATVPDALRPFYAERDGQYVLCLDGAPPGAASQADVATLQAQLADLHLHRAIESAFLAFGGRPAVREFIAAKATAVFEMQGDTVVARPDMFSTARPGAPLTVEEWLGRMRRDHSYAFSEER